MTDSAPSKEYLASLLNKVLLFAIIVALYGLKLDLDHTTRYYGADLWGRVVGARVIKLGLDPYRFQWTPEHPMALQDPCVPEGAPISRVTSPPTVMIFHILLVNFTYTFQRLAWFVLQWAALLASIFLLANISGSPVKSRIIWILGLLVISCSYFWRLHVERGQLYIFYAFLLALSCWMFHQRWKMASFLSGMSAGFAASLRLPLLVMLIPFCIARNVKFIAGAVSGFLLSVLVSILLLGSGMWQNYFSVLPLHTKTNIGQLSNDVYPSQIEDPWLILPYRNSSLQNLIWFSTGIILDSKMMALAWFMVILLCTILAHRFTAFKEPKHAFLFGVLMVIITDYFLPSPKFPYGNVMWLIALGLLVFLNEPARLLNHQALPLFLIAFLMNPLFYFNWQTVLFSEFAMVFFLLFCGFQSLVASPTAQTAESPKEVNDCCRS